jgi:ubiquinone/menaquinone biosynthesis methyltransferase
MPTDASLPSVADDPGPTLSSRLVPEVAARAHSQDGHALAVRGMFDRISPTYDLLNRLLSLGIDRGWRARALEVLGRLASEGAVLDSCAGTLDLTAAIQARWPERTVVAGDFARAMLLAGRTKLIGQARTVACDALRLPFASGAFAAVTCGFGMRNLADPEQGLREAQRVLAPGGALVVLEFFRPVRLATRVFHACYGRGLLPLVGRLVSGDAQAYRYLSRSMRGFLTRGEFEAALTRAGFREVGGADLTFGVASIVWGVK